MRCHSLSPIVLPWASRRKIKLPIPSPAGHPTNHPQQHPGSSLCSQQEKPVSWFIDCFSLVKRLRIFLPLRSREETPFRENVVVHRRRRLRSKPRLARRKKGSSFVFTAIILFLLVLLKCESCVCRASSVGEDTSEGEVAKSGGIRKHRPSTVVSSSDRRDERAEHSTDV